MNSPIALFLGPIESNIVSPKVGSKVVVLPLIQASHDVALAVALAGALLAAAQPQHAQPLPHAARALLERRDLRVGSPCGGAVLPLPGGGPAAVLYSKPGAATAAVVGPVPGGLDAEEAVPAHGVPAHGPRVWAGRGVEVAAVGDGTDRGAHFGVCLGRLLLVEEAESVASLLRVYWLSK